MKFYNYFSSSNTFYTSVLPESTKYSFQKNSDPDLNKKMFKVLKNNVVFKIPC